MSGQPDPNELPNILKSFLSDVYDLKFPDSMERKIALETKKALNQVLLDNIDFFEDFTRQQGGQRPHEQQRPPPMNVEPGYESRSETPQGRQVVSPGRRSAHGHPSQGSYNLITGAASENPYSPPRPHMRQYAQASSNNDIFNRDPNAAPARQTGRRQSNQVYNNQQSRQEDRLTTGRRMMRNGNQSSFSIAEQGDQPPADMRDNFARNGPGRGNLNRRSTSREQDRVDNRAVYNASRTRNQRSNIF